MSVSQDRMERLRRIKETHEEQLLRKPNVVGVGIGFGEQAGRPTDEPVIVVSVNRKVPRHMLDPGHVIPRELEGVRVDVQAIGEPRASGCSGGGDYGGPSS